MVLLPVHDQSLRYRQSHALSRGREPAHHCDGGPQIERHGEAAGGGPHPCRHLQQSQWQWRQTAQPDNTGLSHRGPLGGFASPPAAATLHLVARLGQPRVRLRQVVGSVGAAAMLTSAFTSMLLCITWKHRAAEHQVIQVIIARTSSRKDPGPSGFLRGGEKQSRASLWAADNQCTSVIPFDR